MKCDKNKPARFSIVYCIKFFSKMEKKYLHNGCTIPAIGLGTWQVPLFAFLLTYFSFKNNVLLLCLALRYDHISVNGLVSTKKALKPTKTYYKNSIRMGYDMVGGGVSGDGLDF